MEKLYENWCEQYPELETSPADAKGEYVIHNFGSVEDTVDFFIEAATYE